MSDRFIGTISFPEWALDIPEARKVLSESFGEPETWGSGWFMNKTGGCITLKDDQAANGQFPEVQSCFWKNGIPYDRWSEGYLDIAPETEHYRPELEKPVFFDGNDRFPVFADEIEKILDSPNIKEELAKLLPPKIKELSEYAERGHKPKEAMSVKEQLMALGMKEEDFGRHESDLYVRVTPISTKFLETYQFKNQVERFIDNIEHVPFYDFPFAAMKEKIREDKEEALEIMGRLDHKKRQEPQSHDIPLDGLHKAFERYEENGMEGLCGEWAVRKDISMQSGWWDLSFADQPVAHCHPSEDFTRDGQIGHISRMDEQLSDKSFSDICDIIQSVSPYCQMDPEEQAKINANKKVQGR